MARRTDVLDLILWSEKTSPDGAVRDGLIVPHGMIILELRRGRSIYIIDRLLKTVGVGGSFWGGAVRQIVPLDPMPPDAARPTASAGGPQDDFRAVTGGAWTVRDNTLYLVFGSQQFL